MVELEVGVIQAKVQEGADGSRSERRRENSRIVLQAANGGLHGGTHVAVRVEGHHVQREEVVEGGRRAAAKDIHEVGGVLEAWGTGETGVQGKLFYPI